jgi:sugar/nucleoside kinase (ribokinase family)
MNIDVAGLGNALVDALVRVEDDSVLAALELTKGQMHPVDHSRWSSVFARLHGRGMALHPGGSCANTITALALMGARSVFCGQIGNDDMGKMYAEKLVAACGSHALHVSAKLNTGKCLSIVTPDAERTMVTDLGAAIELPHVGTFAETIRGSRLLYITGYLFLGGPMVDATWEAMNVARDAGVPIALDVADPFVVGIVKDALWKTLHEYASLAFLNQEEAAALTGLDPEKALEKVSESVELTAVKLGSRGSLIHYKDQTTEIAAHRVDAVDTTGAGDAYAAGLLYGWLNGWSMARAGDLGSRVASQTVRQMGAVCRDAALLRSCIESAQPERAS